MTNLHKRILSGLFLAPLFAASIFQTWIFFAVMVLVAIAMLLEWHDMAKSKINYLLLGLPTIVIPIASLIYVRFFSGGAYAILTYFVTIWTIDSFAMFGGRTIGGPKLAPNLSPKKTWSGLFIGALGGAITPVIMSMTLEDFNFPLSGYNLALFGFILGLVEQGSDLFISFFKRKFDIKDSGNIIPGHGGILDRFDGIILTAPLLLGLLI